MSHQVIIFFYWCIAFLGLGRQKLQGGLWGAGLGKTEHQVMRYLSSDNANDQKKMRRGQRLLLLGSYWTLGAQEQISQWQLAALTPWKINHCRQMHKKTTPHSVSHWSWWLNSHVFFLSTLQPVPRGPDVLTAVLLLWQNNTSGFVSAACGEEPQDLVPPLRTLLLLLLHGAEWAPSFWAFAASKFQVWPLTGNSPWGIYFYSSRYKTWFMVSISTEGDGAVTAQRALPSAFPGVQQTHLEPWESSNTGETFLTNLPLVLVGIFKNKDFLHTVEEHFMVSE